MTTLEHRARVRHPHPGETLTDSGGRLLAQLSSGSLTRFATMITGFWSLFWLLNGLDKFFNEPAFFGVTRDAAFVDTFARIGLPAPVALAALYGIGVYEIVLGVAFAVALVSLPRMKGLTALCLEAGLAMFIVFAVGDVLLGNQRELWQHSCYIGLTTLSMMLLRQAHAEAPRRLF